jgi:hypothetical protein
VAELTELVNQFSPKERANIRAAEAEASGYLAHGERTALERARAGFLDDRDFIHAPIDEARALAACRVFVAFQKYFGRTRTRYPRLRFEII